MSLSNDATREQREQMKALSLEIFGASSKWQKLYKYDAALTLTKTETIPGVDGAEDTTKEVEVPLYVEGTKVKQFERKYRTTQEVLDLLLSFKAKRDEYLANMRKLQAEALAKRKADEERKKIEQELAGSAL
jgi:hypothetical protein